jgi:hypothetical protein
MDFKDILSRLRDQAISPIAIDDTTEESMGWCHPHTGEPDFSDSSDWLVGDSLIFGLRIDTKKVPGTLYRLQLRQLLGEMERVRGERGKTASRSADKDTAKGEGASRRLREQAKERVKLELLKRTLPSIRLTEAVWQLKTNEIWLTSASSAVFQAFDSCFVKTFGLPYIFRTPGTTSIDFESLLRGDPESAADIESLLQAVPWGSFGGDGETTQVKRQGALSARAGASLGLVHEAASSRSGNGGHAEEDADDQDAPF